jgi:acid phosphatase class B
MFKILIVNGRKRIYLKFGIHWHHQNAIPPKHLDFFYQADMLNKFTPNAAAFSCPPETLANVIFIHGRLYDTCPMVSKHQIHG